MEVKVEASSGLRREMRVVVPAERVSKAVDERLKRFASRAKLPGFRPGKAPFKVIQQQYGESARLDAISDIVNQTYPEALSQAGVNPAGSPKIDITAEKSGEALEYVAHFEVYPEITLNPLSQLQIERPVVDVGEADIDRLVQNLRKARRTLEVKTGPAAKGDVATMDFLGTLEGEAFQGGEGKDVTIEIGSSQFLPDLENGLIGHAAGEQFSVDVAFPEDYRAENLKGKTAQFAVTLKEVKESVLPAIDENFLKLHSVEDGAGEAGLRAKCKTALEKERDKGVRNQLKGQVLEQLLAANPVEIPQALIAQEIPRLREEAVSRMNMANVPKDKHAELLPDALFEQQAQKRVALGLLIGEVIKTQKVQLDQARVDVALDEMAADYEQPEQVKAYYRSRPEMLQGLRAMVLEDQVVDSLIAGVTPSDKKLSLDELLNPQRPAQA